jgi:hypothetical protein
LISPQISTTTPTKPTADPSTPHTAAGISKIERFTS